jgi:polar amino acid transport system substrate-binding protein
MPAKSISAPEAVSNQSIPFPFAGRSVMNVGTIFHADFIKLRIIAAVILSCPLFTLAEDIVFVNDSAPYCPYTICDKGKDGYVLDVVNAIYKRHGYTVTIKNVPWNRALAIINAGQANGILGVTKNTSPKLIYPRTEIAQYVPAVFSLAANPWKYEGVDSLKKIHLGLVENYGNGEGNPELERYLAGKPENVTYIVADNAIAHLFLMIEAGHIDALIEDQSVATYILQNSGKATLFKHARVQRKIVFGYVGFSDNDQKSRHLADLFDEGMADLRRTGELKSILAAYGLTDWQK